MRTIPCTGIVPVAGKVSLAPFCGFVDRFSHFKPSHKGYPVHVNEVSHE